MKYLDFEKHIKNEFENSKEPVQMDALLASLDLGKEPKRKGFAFWMILPFLILTFSGLAWKFLDSNHLKVDESSLLGGVSPKDGSLTNITSEVGSLSNISPEAGFIANVTSEADSSANITSEAGSMADITSDNGSLENISSEAGIMADITSKDKVSNDINNNIGGVTNYSESSFSAQGEGFNIIKTQINSSKNNNSGVSDSEENLNKNEKSTIKTNNNTPPANKAQPINKSKNSYPIQSGRFIEKADLDAVLSQPNESSTPSNSARIGNPTAAISKSLSRGLLSINGLEQSKSIDILSDNEVDGELFSRMKINCPSFENPSWHMALIPEVGVFLPKKTLAQNGFGESQAFQERLESESTLEGIQLGLYGMVVRDNIPFYLKAGLSYSRISERMELEYETTRLDTTEGLIAVTVSGNGDTLTYIKGDIVKEIIETGSNRQHHYIHLFDIPISIGYTAYIAGLDVGFEGGVKVNFMTRATGNLLTSPTEYTNLSLNRYFKNRIGLSYFGGLMIGRNFGKFGDFYIAPRFTYYPNEFNNQNNNVSQKYFTIGLNAGVVYKIN